MIALRSDPARWNTRWARALSWVPLAAAVVVVLYRLRDFLVPGTLPARGDPSLPFQGSDLTPAFGPWVRVAMDALWTQHSFPFWNPNTHSGAPLFEAPSMGTLSLATWLGAVLPYELALKGSMLLHVIAGMFGVFALAVTLRVRRASAGVGALAFGLGTFLLDHFRVGHLNHIYPMAWMPWVLLAIWKSIVLERGGYRWALAAGAMVAAEVVEGADSGLLYQALALGLCVVSLVPGPARLIHLRRVATSGALAAIAAFAVSAPQLLPMLSHMQRMARGAGVSLADSMSTLSEVTHPVPGDAYLLLLVLGLAALRQTGQRRPALWMASIALLGYGVANSTAVYSFLWHYVPGFRYQRIPQRGLMLLGVAGPVLVAAGVDGAWSLLSQWSRIVALPLWFVLVGWLGNEMWTLAPPTPPMARTQPELDANEAMQWLKQHANGARIHVWDSPNRHWGTEHVTIPLGLEEIAGFSPVEHPDYCEGDFDPPGHRTFLGESYRLPARLWGMLSVRYVLSRSAMNVPGLRLATVVKPCPVSLCQPAKSSGPFIYENESWLPRAWQVKHVVAVVGASRPAFEASLDILALPNFDPGKVGLVQVQPGEPLPPVDVAVSAGAALPGLIQWGDPAASAAVEKVLLQAAGDSPVPADFQRKDDDQIRIHAKDRGWLLVSERIAMFPGWASRVSQGKTRIYRADGVLGALFLESPDEVQLSYRPPLFLLGLLLFVTFVASWGGYEILMARRGSKPGERVDGMPGPGSPAPPV